MGAGGWLVVLRAVLDLVAGRRGPQDIPASRPLFLVTITFYFAASAGLTAVAVAWPLAIKAAMVDTTVMPAFVVTVLWLRSHPERALQTLTAVAGVGALFSLAAIPPFMFIAGVPQSPFSALASLVVLVLFIWNVLVLGHILRHALALAFPAGMLVAMAYVAVSMIAAGWVVPEVVT